MDFLGNTVGVSDDMLTEEVVRTQDAIRACLKDGVADSWVPHVDVVAKSYGDMLDGAGVTKDTPREERHRVFSRVLSELKSKPWERMSFFLADGFGETASGNFEKKNRVLNGVGQSIALNRCLPGVIIMCSEAWVTKIDTDKINQKTGEAKPGVWIDRPVFAENREEQLVVVGVATTTMRVVFSTMQMDRVGGEQGQGVIIPGEFDTQPVVDLGRSSSGFSCQADIVLKIFDGYLWRLRNFDAPTEGFRSGEWVPGEDVIDAYNRIVTQNPDGDPQFKPRPRPPLL